MAISDVAKQAILATAAGAVEANNPHVKRTLFMFSEISLSHFTYHSRHLDYIYGLEAYALTKSELFSLDFTVNRFFMKLFRTGRGRSELPIMF